MAPQKDHEVNRIVMKFGGTSVADIERIRAVAARVKAEWESGKQVVVVVSAMAGVTNQMVSYCHALSPNVDMREYDAVVAAGEQVTSGLTALALQAIGVPAQSWLGWQIPIITDDAHGKANILGIDGARLIRCLEAGIVPVVAGFQGVCPADEAPSATQVDSIATLGRGGSDTSAVAIAASVKADRCDIYTDVDGIYTTDPRIVSAARKLDRITFEEMLELASVGAKVLQTRSVALAMRERVRVRVLSSFDESTDDSGSSVVDEEEVMEKDLVTGIAYALDEAKITVSHLPDRPGIAAAIFSTLAAARVNVDMIVQSVGSDGSTNMTFTVPKTDQAAAISALEAAKGDIQFGAIQSAQDVAKISVVGVGMRSHSGMASTMFTTLAERGINVQVISTSEIKISVLIKAEYLELAVRALHTAYGLDDQDGGRQNG
ncbi:aspartate kinase [Candidatus Kirkpatrickella diaphorinae]|uniref:Aspartokinase n=1 Tax=Candidatus Kirkpatrickella diaphorinae TaxID=2984322 RepID=A0ABY6GLQ1_9PROT|nr:aspartate kinase [Candidatus Kirkpatrickella diaphorinae]UYH51775.1 aspartate kinase [Candidatus Kirkpatrickella diaphorinae]